MRDGDIALPGARPLNARDPAVDVLDATARSSLFHGLDAGATSRVAAAATVRRARRGAVLFKQGDAAVELNLVVDGWVRMTHLTRDGDQVGLRFMRAGDPIGCQAVFRGMPYPATATVCADATFVTWKSAFVREAIAASPVVAGNAMDLIGDRATEFMTKMRELATEPVERRLARQLVGLVRDSRDRDARGVSVAFPISRQDLAEMCGSNLYTVTRVLSRWRDAGHLESGRQRIVVRDVGALEAIIGER
jgi:CRP-like cAMP-binding protein